MGEYTPTTQVVSEVYQGWRASLQASDPSERIAEFDRWLAGVKRDAAAEVRAEVRQMLETYRDYPQLPSVWLAVALTPLTEEAWLSGCTCKA